MRRLFHRQRKRARRESADAAERETQRDVDRRERRARERRDALRALLDRGVPAGLLGGLRSTAVGAQAVVQQSRVRAAHEGRGRVPERVAKKEQRRERIGEDEEHRHRVRESADRHRRLATPAVRDRSGWYLERRGQDPGAGLEQSDLGEIQDLAL